MLHRSRSARVGARLLGVLACAGCSASANPPSRSLDDPVIAVHEPPTTALEPPSDVPALQIAPDTALDTAAALDTAEVLDTAATTDADRASEAAPNATSEAARLHAELVRRVQRMPQDSELVQRVTARGLSLVNVAWEDTGRAEGSSLGPNITDLTLQVQYEEDAAKVDRALMPVIRYPNFGDRTADVRASRFFVRTGNQVPRPEGREPKLDTVLLDDAIRNIAPLLSRPKELVRHGNLHALRDTHFLISAQAVFLPIPAVGRATFDPVVFNYQSAPGSPAVLTLLSTRQGTSVAVVENRGEDRVAGWGQQLYFNDGGQRARLTAERRSAVASRIEAQGGARTEDEASALQSGADVLFLVQIPLRHEQRGVLGGLSGGAGYGFGGLGLSGIGQGGGGLGAGRSRGVSDVEQAVLGHGEKLGPFIETNGLALVRDPKFPVRITVQFYKATSNGVVSDADLDAISRSIESVYEHADFVGSLVLPEGDRRRPTAWQSIPNEWFPW